jgi:hypothetical protein
VYDGQHTPIDPFINNPCIIQRRQAMLLRHRSDGKFVARLSVSVQRRRNETRHNQPTSERCSKARSDWGRLQSLQPRSRLFSCFASAYDSAILSYECREPCSYTSGKCRFFSAMTCGCCSLSLSLSLSLSHSECIHCFRFCLSAGSSSNCSYRMLFSLPAR